MSKMEKDRSKAVQSGLWRVWDIYRPVSVLVSPKIGKKPDWTGPQNTNYCCYIRCSDADFTILLVCSV